MSTVTQLWRITLQGTRSELMRRLFSEGVAVFKSVCLFLAIVFFTVAGFPERPVLAQESLPGDGGNVGTPVDPLQSMPDLGAAGQLQSGTHGAVFPGGGSAINNNFYFQNPGFRRDHFYNCPPTFGYGHSRNRYYGYPYGYSHFDNRFSYGPLFLPPAITVVPHGIPLTGAMLNGAYSTPTMPYGYDYGIGDPPLLFPRQGFPALGANAMGANIQNRPQVAPQPPAPRRPPAPGDEITRRVAALKPSTDAGRLRSDELMADGDREFAEQQYRRAAAKYREAIAKAPDYPPAHLRAGHAYVATGDYDLAITYLGMGFELARTIDRPGFSLADLYRGNNLAKDQHNEALADAVLRQPEDGGLLFLTGITQHYDGKPLQARDYFRRASQIHGRHQPYAEMFLPLPK